MTSRPITGMQLSILDGDLDGADSHNVYDANCNTTMNRRGHMRLCRDAMSTTALERNGWERLHTSGRNSYIFRRPGWILKVAKHYIAPDYYCPGIRETMYRIRLLCDGMGPLAPVKHIRFAIGMGNPLTLLMRDGETRVALPSVTGTDPFGGATSRAQ